MFLKWNAFTFFRLLYCFFFIITSLYFTILDYFYLTEFIPSFTFDLFFIFPTVSHIYFPSFSFHLRSSIFPYIFFFLVYCWRPSLFISFILIIHTQLSYRFLFFPFSPLTSCFFFFNSFFHFHPSDIVFYNTFLSSLSSVYCFSLLTPDLFDVLF